MKFRSFEELKRIHHRAVTGMGVVRFVLSVVAATAVLSGLVMLIPLGT
jgi:hypothetical protein